MDCCIIHIGVRTRPELAAEVVARVGDETVEVSLDSAVIRRLCGADLPDEDKVFDKYYRIARAQRRSGSGLGLYLARSLLLLMSGTITFSSAWTQITRHSGMPLTRAVVMYSWLSSFIMKLRVILLMYAIDT